MGGCTRGLGPLCTLLWGLWRVRRKQWPCGHGQAQPGRLWREVEVRRLHKAEEGGDSETPAGREGVHLKRRGEGDTHAVTEGIHRGVHTHIATVGHTGTHRDTHITKQGHDVKGTVRAAQRAQCTVPKPGTRGRVQRSNNTQEMNACARVHTWRGQRGRGGATSASPTTARRQVGQSNLLGRALPHRAPPGSSG